MIIVYVSYTVKYKTSDCKCFKRLVDINGSKYKNEKKCIRVLAILFRFKEEVFVNHTDIINIPSITFRYQTSPRHI